MAGFHSAASSKNSASRPKTAVKWLQQYGSLEDLVKMTIYLVNIKNNTEVWRARREFFTGDFPASTLVEVRALGTPETLVEIETVAYLGKA